MSEIQKIVEYLEELERAHFEEELYSQESKEVAEACFDENGEIILEEVLKLPDAREHIYVEVLKLKRMLDNQTIEGFLADQLETIITNHKQNYYEEFDECFEEHNMEPRQYDYKVLVSLKNFD